MKLQEIEAAFHSYQRNHSTSVQTCRECRLPVTLHRSAEGWRGQCPSCGKRLTTWSKR